MKRKFILVLFLVLSVLLAACQDDKDPTTTDTTKPAESTQPIETTDPDKDTTKPVIKGAYTTEIDVGEPFDPLEGVTAEDDVDGDITDRIQVIGEVDVHTPGTYIITYKVKDSAGNETVVERTVRVRGVGLIVNPYFDEPLEVGWNLWFDAGGGANASASIVDGEAKIVITAIGGQNWSVQFEQKDITLEQGKKYTISFEARADEPRSIGVLMEDPNNNYYKYGNIVINLTTEMTKYNLHIEVDTVTITTGKFAFMLGKVDANSKPTTVYIDNVIMKEVSEFEDTNPPVLYGVEDIVINLGSTFDPLDGVTVEDDLDKTLTVNDIIVEGTVDTDTEGDYELIYRVSDAAGNETVVKRIVTVKPITYTDTEEIINGDFSEKEPITSDHSNEEAWREWHHNEGQQVSYEITDGRLVVTISNVGWTSGAWSIQLQQAGIKLEQGKTYALKFDAYSSIPRKIDVTFKTVDEYPYFTTIVNLSPNMKTYELRFTVNDATNDNMVLSIGMGRIDDQTPEACQIIFDNFVLYTIEY